VVGSISSEAVDLVDDHGVDVALLEDAVEHGLEPGSVGRVLGAGVVVDVLIDHGPALLADELEAGFPLGREREPLLGVVAGCLLVGGDAKVDHAAHRP
jgi:hypothetical protein